MPTVLARYKGKSVVVISGEVNLETQLFSGNDRPMTCNIRVNGAVEQVPADEVEITSIEGLPYTRPTPVKKRIHKSSNPPKGKMHVAPRRQR